MKFFFITNMAFSFSYYYLTALFFYVSIPINMNDYVLVKCYDIQISLYVALPKITIFIKTNIMSTTDPFMDFVVVLSFA